MAQNRLKLKIRRVLQKVCYEGDRLHIRDSADEDLHVIIVSAKLAKKRPRERREIIWSELFRELSREEWGKITLTQVVSPQGANGLLAHDLKARV